MNRRRIGREFEREAHEILKEKFDRVHWLSESNNSSFDFQCFKDGKTFYGDAKVVSSGKITLRFTQKDADFVIAKVDGKVVFLWREEFGNQVAIEKTKSTAIKIESDLMNRLNILKYDIGCKTIEETIQRLIELATPHIQAASPEVKAKGKKLAVSGKTNRARGSPDVKEEK